MFAPDTPDAPPLPSAAPLTAAAATRWRAARTAWRLDGRWPALLPAAFVILATAVEPTPGDCNVQGVCRDTWGSSLAAWSVLAEVVLLAGRFRAGRWSRRPSSRCSGTPRTAWSPRSAAGRPSWSTCCSPPR